MLSFSVEYNKEEWQFHTNYVHLSTISQMDRYVDCYGDGRKDTNFMREKHQQVAAASWKTSGLLPYVLGLVSILWLPFGLSTGVNDLTSSHLQSPHYIAMAIGAALFVGLYLWGIVDNTWYLVTSTPPLKATKISVWLTFALLLTLSIIMVGFNISDWGGFFIFTSSYASGRLPTTQAIWAIGIIMIYPFIGLLTHAISIFEFSNALFLIGIVGFIVIVNVRSYRTSQELRIAREEIAHLAVTTERLRIARDLHDLLGHNLSLIALKSELARRLIEKDIQRASSEVSDIEQVARTMLQEVREAVGSYRQPTLASELHGVQEILNAAGIAYHYEGEEHILDDLPQSIEAVLAWTVREGVTNIIRHSRARQCTIRMTRTRQQSSVEILNDGLSVDDQEQDNELTHHGGNGLRGLTERVAALGGQLSSGPHLHGGFRLAVALPLAYKGEKTPITIGLSLPTTTIASEPNNN